MRNARREKRESARGPHGRREFADEQGKTGRNNHSQQNCRPAIFYRPADRPPSPSARSSPAARRRRANQAKPTTEPPISKPPALPRVLHHPHRRAQRARAPAGTWSTALRWLLFHHRELDSMSLYYHLFCRRDHRVLLVIIIAIIAGSDRGSGVSGAKGRADKHARFSRRGTDILISKSMSMRRRASGD